MTMRAALVLAMDGEAHLLRESGRWLVAHEKLQVGAD
jgi:hypothetical protein